MPKGSLAWQVIKDANIYNTGMYYHISKDIKLIVLYNPKGELVTCDIVNV